MIASTSHALYSKMDGRMLSEAEMTAVNVLSNIQPPSIIRRRMSLLQHHRNKESGSDEVPSVKPRRNPRRENVLPRDYRLLERSFYSDARAKAKPRSEQDILHEQRQRQAAAVKTATGKTRSESQQLGAVYRPASPLSSLPRRSWPAVGMHERPVWPDVRHELPAPPLDAAPMDVAMHHVLHAMLDFGLEMTADQPRRYRLEEKLAFMEAMLNKRMKHKSSGGDIVVDLVDKHPHYDLDQRMTVLHAKVKRMTALLEGRREDADVEVDGRGTARCMGLMTALLEGRHEDADMEAETDGRHVDAGTARCMGLMPACMDCEGQEDCSNLLGALLCNTGYLYCITNDVTPEQLAAYLDAIRDQLPNN